MPRSKSKYVLDSPDETERLEKQARMSAFDFEQELQFLELLEGQRILDAGCGSGIISEYLSRRAARLEVVGCDFSKDRVEEAKARHGSAKNIRFVQQDLLDPNRSLGRFDTIVCRFVLRHFNPSDGKKVIRNLFEALMPGGTLVCIDGEGVMGDIYPASSFLKSALRKIREAKVVDFQVARKLPALLLEQGLEKVDWHALTSEFKGEDLTREIANLEQTTKNAEAFFQAVLGGSEAVERFKSEYFSALRGPGALLFYTRIIATGKKPNRELKLVKPTSGS